MMTSDNPTPSHHMTSFAIANSEGTPRFEVCFLCDSTEDVNIAVMYCDAKLAVRIGAPDNGNLLCGACAACAEMADFWERLREKTIRELGGSVMDIICGTLRRAEDGTVFAGPFVSAKDHSELLERHVTTLGREKALRERMERHEVLLKEYRNSMCGPHGSHLGAGDCDLCERYDGRDQNT